MIIERIVKFWLIFSLRDLVLKEFSIAISLTHKYERNYSGGRLWYQALSGYKGHIETAPSGV